MKTIFLVGAICVGLTLSGCNEESVATAGTALPNCPGKSFARQASIFDVFTICATSDVDDNKLTFAANVAAEWLDNDGDGVVDEPRLITAMQASQPFLIMTSNGPSQALLRDISSALDTRVGQDLSASETNPSGRRRDASQEEIHHLILNSAWKVAFPSIFNDAPGSNIYQQWALAEQQGNYSYDDPTCDANCKVVEFFYLATAAYLGSSADLVSDEMRLKDRASLIAALPKTVAVMEAADYNYPLNHWPTGTYEHKSNITYAPAGE